MSDLHVIIAGGGLGGLALAQGLVRAGVSVAVYEKDPSPEFRNQGYRIRINPDGIAALQAVLAPEAFALFAATAGNPGARMDAFDHQLNLVDAQELPPVPGLPGEGHLAVNRRTLRQILLAGLEEVVRFDARLTGYSNESSGTVTAHFADGSSATGDVLVGADGVNSAVRTQRLPEAEVLDAGLRLVYGKVLVGGSDDWTRLPADLLGLWTTVLGPDRRFVGLAPVHFREGTEQAAVRLAPQIEMSPENDYLACVFGIRRELLGHTDDELFAMKGSDLQELELSMLDGWHPALREIVARQDPDSIFPVSVRTSVPLAPWQTNAVTLLGDAIHVMSPAIGVGANTALRDACVLAEHLGRAAASGDVFAALRAYEAEMVEYGYAAVRESAERGHRLVGQNSLPTVA